MKKKINLRLHPESIRGLMSLVLGANAVIIIALAVLCGLYITGPENGTTPSFWLLPAILICWGILLFFLKKQIRKHFFNPLRTLKEYIRQLNKGELPEAAVESNDEAGSMIRDMNLLAANLRNVKSFALEVGQGKFDTEIDIFNDQGALGHSLATMRDSLKKVAGEDTRRNWATEGLARFGEILRTGNDNVETLSAQIIAKLVKYLEANQGGLYILNSDSDPHTMELIAAYAFERKKFLEKSVLPGEGLVGQVWQEGESVYMTDIPQDYIRISSGLGDANPRSLLIVPLKVNETVLGIIEVASFHAFLPYQIKFVEKLGESIASTISSVRVNERTKKLLEESQQQAEELKAQEEEMRQNMEEMQATQEEMRRIQHDMETQTKIIDSTALVSRTDIEGRIIYVNEELLKWSRFSREELIGKNHRIMKSGHQPPELYENLWKTITEGKIWRGEMKNRAKDGSMFWADSIVAPVLDDYGKPREYLALRFVINDKKEKEETMKKMMAEDSAQMEALRMKVSEAEAHERELLLQLNEIKQQHAKA